jgi:carbon-monoxide dehydrogenase small subunit
MTASFDETVTLDLTVNGEPRHLTVPANRTLASLLREDLGLTGAKLACSRAVCGACTVLIDGAPVAACAQFAFQVDGAAITTIEGLAGPGGTLDPVQQAFKEMSAFQCGYCTAGMILLARALLNENPEPDRATIVDWVSSNICRCTGYQMIVEAVERAAAIARERAA